MKKLMMFAAATMFVAVSSYAGLPLVVCDEDTDSTCASVVFNFKESGKLAQFVDKKGYKTTESFSSKGYLVVYSSEGQAVTNYTYTTNAAAIVTNKVVVTNDTPWVTNSVITTNSASIKTNATVDTSAVGLCCPDGVALILTQKVNGEKTTLLYTDLEITRFSVFGKNWAKLEEIEALQAKKGKSVTMESDLGFMADGVAPVVGEEEGPDTTFIYSGFGSTQVGLSKGTSGTCNDSDGCEVIVTPKSYKGWFAGFFSSDAQDNVQCLTCDCPDSDIFGGTWTAKFNKKITKLSSAESALGL